MVGYVVVLGIILICIASRYMPAFAATLGSQGKLTVYPCSVVVVVVVHTFKSSSFLKPLGQSNSNFMWSILRKGERKFV